MNILFDIGHPAHVHLFKNFILYLKNNDHNIYIATRNKDVTNTLLKYYNLNYTSLTNPATGLFSMLGELIKRDYLILKKHKKYNFDISFGTSVSIGHLSLFTKVKSYNFCEDDDSVIPIQAMISYPFNTGVIIPECLRYTKWRSKRIKYNSYHELAYLHPNNFTPNIEILNKYNLAPLEYIIIRNSALKAHHDINVKGLKGNVWERVYKIISNYHLVYSKENEKSHQIEPWDMHHIIAFAKLVISDSQTMSAEAAVLGVPSLRYNSFVGRISYLEELEHKYGLTYGFKPGYEKSLIRTLNEMLINKNIKNEWLQKRKRMLSEKVDLNQWMIDFFEKELKK